MKQSPVIVLITAVSKKEAESIAQVLVEKKLSACVSIVSEIHSIFFWDQKLCREDEILLIAKTMQNRIREIVATVKKMHSYDVPEIIAIPVIDGSEDYLNWLRKSTP